MRALRPAARILLLDRAGRILLFRFVPADRPPFWVTPGGAVERGESYEAAARRELLEETGLDADPGAVVARRVVQFLTLEGVEVDADERFFRLQVDECAVDTAGHTELERRIMQEWRWFTPAELADWPELIFPVDLADMLLETAPHG
ncbi:NUDIX hydrolase [Sphingomonas jatrophae]|uniref:ADP-ribose pyrophosphatase YjhB, NUDIX family n=1 Tax=Sphingomonas jatrophae TaxID=1166337 RepID=A0A1I6LI56_9SPHN|nr:NUDIX domain-containing protein [Sphingomonas jatrophae]SFS03139.1 ADP-ribose pyrophosphatase YjhB, NUDIX family [Sphingomonas jatrophae]